MSVLTKIDESMTESLAIVIGGVAEFVAVVVAASYLSRVSAVLVVGMVADRVARMGPCRHAS
jgi:hypothetical protein